MPGVPSSRGCDGCRKQKKKCVAISPPCLRCRRLNIPCVRLGQQRYKFVSEENQLVKLHGIAIGNPSQNICNDLTSLISAFVRLIDPSADVGFNLLSTFGAFLADVPRRLGTNEALDVASDCFTAAYLQFCTGAVGSNRQVLEKHGRVIKVLQCSLRDPDKASAPETLCAIQLMMIYQAFLGKSPWISHSRGIAQILKSREHSGPNNEFEENLLLAQRASMIVEGLLDEKISLTRQQWADLIESKFDKDSLDAQNLRYLSRVPSLMQRGRDALKISHINASPLSELIVESRALRDSFQPIVAQIRTRVDETDLNLLSRYDGPAHWKPAVHASRSRLYGFGLTVAIIINCVVESLDPTDHMFSEQSMQFAEQIVTLATVVRKYRPLGTLYMQFCLCAAWTATDSTTTKTTIESLMGEYRSDLLGYRPTSTIELEWVAQRLTLRESRLYEEVFRNVA